MSSFSKSRVSKNSSIADFQINVFFILTQQFLFKTIHSFKFYLTLLNISNKPVIYLKSK